MKTNSKYHSEVEVIIRFLRGELSETENKKFELWLNKKQENKTLFKETKKIWDHTNNLSSLKSIEVNKDWQKTKQRIDFMPEKRTFRIQALRNFSFWRVAAVIVVLLGIGILINQFLFTPQMILVETTDFTKEFVLPDGSQAFLNYNSSLQYPEKFQRNKRLISLSGEGYFEVSRNPDKRFKINVEKKAFVEVLGTSFNIKSEKEKGEIDVNVLGGKVAFYIPENTNSKTILVTNENALLQNGIIVKNPPKDKNFLSWRTGVITFEDEKLENVCKVLSQFYKQEIITKGLEHEKIRFTSTIDNQKLESVLEEIKLVLNLEYTINKRTVFIHKPE